MNYGMKLRTGGQVVENSEIRYEVTCDLMVHNSIKTYECMQVLASGERLRNKLYCY